MSDEATKTDATDTTETLMTSAADTTESTDSSQADDAKGQEPEAKAADPQKEEAKADDAKSEDKADTDADKPDPATFEFKTPDDVEMAEETLTGVRDLSKELGLDQEQAQKIVDLGSQLSQRWAKDLQDAHAAQVSEWAEQAKADKEIGGEKFDQSMADAKAAYDKFATPELTSFLNESGMGNHPEMIRLFARLQKQVGDDTLVAGQPKPGAPKTRAEILYGTH